MDHGLSALIGLAVHPTTLALSSGSPHDILAKSRSPRPFDHHLLDDGLVVVVAEEQLVGGLPLAGSCR